MALLMPASTSMCQYTQPFFASSAKRSPSAPPTYMRPPATTGCVPPDLAPGSPNAQASFRRGTSRAVIAAASPDWKRVFVIPAPQPFQLGPVSKGRNGLAVLPQKAEAGIIAGALAN